MRAAPPPAAAAGEAAPPRSEPYVWKNVAIVAGGFMPGIEFDPAQAGLVYIRADIGGAYRLDRRQKNWTPLIDWAGIDQWNDYGIESLAVDPSDPNRVYIAAGLYTNHWAGNGAMLALERSGPHLAEHADAVPDGRQRRRPVDGRAAGGRSARWPRAVLRLAPQRPVDQHRSWSDVEAGDKLSDARKSKRFGDRVCGIRSALGFGGIADADDVRRGRGGRYPAVLQPGRRQDVVGRGGRAAGLDASACGDQSRWDHVCQLCLRRWPQRDHRWRGLSIRHGRRRLEGHHSDHPHPHRRFEIWIRGPHGGCAASRHRHGRDDRSMDADRRHIPQPRRRQDVEIGRRSCHARFVNVPVS